MSNVYNELVIHLNRKGTTKPSFFYNFLTEKVLRNTTSKQI